MTFKELQLNEEYRTGSSNVVKDFFTPLLSRAITYKRAVGFFSSTALIQISKGLADLVMNGGKVQLIVSPHLSEEDIDAITTGYEEREKIIEAAVLKAFYEPKTEYEEERLNLLATLIAEGKLDIKIAFTKGYGMYHEKMGLIYDKDFNIVAFSGSTNESETAFSHNYEVVDVFCSWHSESDRKRVENKEFAFHRLWTNADSSIIILDFPEVAKEKFQSYKRDNVDFDIDAKDNITETDDDIAQNKPFSKPFFKPRDYQTQAIDSWVEKGFVGIFDMATGTGKTLTGLGAVEKLFEHTKGRLGVIIVCPYQHLVEQWVEDIEKFGIKPIIGYSASPQKNWYNRLSTAIQQHKLRARGHEFFCFVCTNAMFSTQKVQSLLSSSRGNLLLLVDEAHNFGAIKLSRLLLPKYNYRLALSATIERHNDPEGTATLYSYFGDKCIEYPLDRAIAENKLTKYKYHPIVCTLNEEELSRFIELSNEIKKCSVFGKDGKRKLSERGKRLALARARLVAGIADKVDKLEEYILPYKNDRHILVYCGATTTLLDGQDKTDTDECDLRQISAVKDLLGNKLGMKVAPFTSEEDMMTRSRISREFSEGENLQALVAIKCLDEGVNIPAIRTAFILASTTNPKEYIQRRGRVLRLYEGKDYAEIYDFIALPRSLNEASFLTTEQRKRELTLVKNELARAEEFARIAINTPEAVSIIEEIKQAYSINDFAFNLEEDYLND